MPHSLSLLLAPSRALSLSSPPLRLAPTHPPLRLHHDGGHLLVGTTRRQAPSPRRRRLHAARASAPSAAAASPVGPAGEGGEVGGRARKAAGYRNRFLDLARLGAVAESAAEALFRSEIRRRLAVTAVLILLSRVGYFVPLPGFDRRLIPDSYLSFAPLPAGLFPLQSSENISSC